MFVESLSSASQFEVLLSERVAFDEAIKAILVKDRELAVYALNLFSDRCPFACAGLLSSEIVLRAEVS